jgi:hypothetical protein
MGELGEVLELLHDAAGRITTLSATEVDWRDHERSRQAHEAAAGGQAQVAWYSPLKGDKAPPLPAVSEQHATVSFSNPGGRYRLERDADPLIGRPPILHVCDGEREWTYIAALGRDKPRAWVQRPSRHQFSELLDPSWLPAACTLTVAGRSARRGRPMVELRGRPRPQQRLAGRVFGADEVLATVDAASGVLLDLVCLFEDEPFARCRLDDVRLGEPLADELFRFAAPPGVRVEEAETVRRRAGPASWWRARGPAGWFRPR